MDAPPLNRRLPIHSFVAVFALALPIGICFGEEGERTDTRAVDRPVRMTPSDLVTEEEQGGGNPSAVVPGLVRKAHPLVTNLLISPYQTTKQRTPVIPVVAAEKKQPPAYTPPPLVVKPPIAPAQYPKPPGENPGPGPKGAPEPGSLAAGLVGGSLMLAAWWRERRRRHRKGAASEASAVEGEPEPGLA
ncbi:MAG: hypothetical protein U0736_26010 [Gemmataceae bacterium]